MQIAFDKKSLRQICESECKAKSDLGAKVADVLKRRLADLRAATCVNDLVAGRPRTLESARREKMVVEICDGFRLIFCVNHSNIPVLESGEVDWSRVNRIKILEIGSDHGSR